MKATKYTNSRLTNFKNFFIALVVILIISIFSALILYSWSFSSGSSRKYEKIVLKNLNNLPQVQLKDKHAASKPRNAKCTYWDCFNIYRCGRTGHDRIAVYIYPLKEYVDVNGAPGAGLISKQYYLILDSIRNSKYYTANPHEACLLVPSIDTLNQERVRSDVVSKALQSLP